MANVASFNFAEYQPDGFHIKFWHILKPSCRHTRWRKCYVDQSMGSWRSTPDGHFYDVDHLNSGSVGRFDKPFTIHTPCFEVCMDE